MSQKQYILETLKSEGVLPWNTLLTMRAPDAKLPKTVYGLMKLNAKLLNAMVVSRVIKPVCAATRNEAIERHNRHTRRLEARILRAVQTRSWKLVETLAVTLAERKFDEHLYYAGETKQ